MASLNSVSVNRIYKVLFKIYIVIFRVEAMFKEIAGKRSAADDMEAERKKQKVEEKT